MYTGAELRDALNGHSRGRPEAEPPTETGVKLMGAAASWAAAREYAEKHGGAAADASKKLAKLKKKQQRSGGAAW